MWGGSRYHRDVPPRPALRLVPPAPGSAVPSEQQAPESFVQKGGGEERRPTLDDLEIVNGILAGDPSVATAFHDRARPRIDATIVRLLGRREVDHEDSVQNVLIAIVDSLPRFRGECSLDTWVARITAHTIWKELRRRTTARKIFDPAELDPESLMGEPDLEHRIGTKNLLGKVREHLAALDPQKSWTLILHDVAGFDLREVAEITEVSVAAAQSRLVRGRRDLEERLRDDPEFRDLMQRGGR